VNLLNFDLVTFQKQGDSFFLLMDPVRDTI
jgi:hypothetical protein